jgi:acetoin utilization deacetylase AcuC-like enzyme
MTIVFAHPRFRDHDTRLGSAHPEHPGRLTAIEAELERRRLWTSPDVTRGDVLAAGPVDPLLLGAVHHPAVLERARAAAQRVAEGGGGEAVYLDPDTPLSRDSVDVALLAAGTAVAAVREVASGAHGSALCLLRPPGHHATPATSMGFCIFNNVAVAARAAQRLHGLGRVLIVDWDVHHGNGTQDAFYDDDSVTFFSIHRHPFYPGTGRETETGTGKGLGATVNVPLAFGTPREQFVERFRAGLERAAERARPELVLISAGFDAHAADPVGNLGLASDDYGTLTRLVCDVADVYCDGRIVSCLEGGYDLTALGESVATHLEALVARSLRRSPATP